MDFFSWKWVGTLHMENIAEYKYIIECLFLFLGRAAVDPIGVSHNGHCFGNSDKVSRGFCRERVRCYEFTSSWERYGKSCWILPWRHQFPPSILCIKPNIMYFSLTIQRHVMHQSYDWSVYDILMQEYLFNLLLTAFYTFFFLYTIWPQIISYNVCVVHRKNKI